jgi:protein CpxP
MNHGVRVLTVAVVAALLATGTAFAQGGPRLRDGFGGQGFGGGRGPGARMAADPAAMLPLRQLDLTEAQRTQIRQLAERHRSEVRPLLERLRSAAGARRQAMEASPLDEGRIRGAVEELSRVEADLAVHRARLRSEIFALLTPEQQQRAEQLRAERDARLQQRRL